MRYLSLLSAASLPTPTTQGFFRHCRPMIFAGCSSTFRGYSATHPIPYRGANYKHCHNRIANPLHVLLHSDRRQDNGCNVKHKRKLDPNIEPISLNLKGPTAATTTTATTIVAAPANYPIANADTIRPFAMILTTRACVSSLHAAVHLTAADTALSTAVSAIS